MAAEVGFSTYQRSIMEPWKGKCCIAWAVRNKLSSHGQTRERVSGSMAEGECHEGTAPSSRRIRNLRKHRNPEGPDRKKSEKNLRAGCHRPGMANNEALLDHA